MDYQQTLEEATKRIKTLAEQRDAIDREMQGLMRIIEGAQIIAAPPEPVKLPVITEADTKSGGFTYTVRLILSRSRTPLLPTEIRDALEAMGVEASSPKVLLIHVHNTLRRLFENDEIEQVPRDGKMAYRSLTNSDLFARVLSSNPLLNLFGAVAGVKRHARPPSDKSSVGEAEATKLSAEK